jgi:hypothetical protein
MTSDPIRPRARARSAAFVAGLALLATLVTAPAAPAAATCSNPPAVIPADQLVAGVTGSGVTTLEGTTLVPFNFRIVGVIPDGWMLGMDAIVIQITGPSAFLSQTHGIFFGMSGSPAYVGGRLAGAVSAVFWEDATYGVLTPAESMLRLVEEPGAMSEMAKRISPTDAIARSIARDEGVAVSELTGTFQRLPVLLGVSGVPSAALNKLQHRMRKHGEDVQVYAAGSAAIDGPVVDTQFRPGEPVGAAISYGDASIYATGTATFVCDDVVAAFGHPLFYDAPGDVSLGLAGASALAVIGGQLFPGARFANLTEPRGTIVSDTFVGSVGIVGQEPVSIPITSDLTNLDDGTSRHGETEAFFTEGYWLESLVWSHLYSNIAAVTGHFGPGTTALDWEIDGTREDGTPFTVANHAKVASEYDAGEVIYWLTSQIEALEYNGFEDFDVTGVSMTGTTTTDQLSAEIGRISLASPLDKHLQPRHVIRAHPGDRITVEVELNATDPDLEDTTTTMTLVVPRHASGDRRITIAPGRGWWPDHRIRSFDDLLEALNDGTHTDDLVMTGFGERVRRQPYVVQGRARFTIDIVR